MLIENEARPLWQTRKSSALSPFLVDLPDVLLLSRYKEELLSFNAILNPNDIMEIVSL
jgi:hypothetical protein